MTGSTTDNNEISELRMFTRSIVVLALFTGLLYLRVFVVEGVAANPVLPLAFLLVAMVALLGTWRWEAVAGAVAVAGGGALSGLIYTAVEPGNWVTAVFYGSPFAVAGLLSLLDWWQDSRRDGAYA